MNYTLRVIDGFSLKNDNWYDRIAKLVEPINDIYPNYNDWLYKKFFSGLESGSRKIIVAYENAEKPMGAALLKDTAEEKKICCLFVRKDCRRCGVADNLMKKSLAVLKTNKPLLSVADVNVPQLQKLLDKYHFVFSYRQQGAYRENNVENYYNNEATEKLKNDILIPLFAHKLKQR